MGNVDVASDIITFCSLLDSLAERPMLAARENPAIVSTYVTPLSCCSSSSNTDANM